MRSPLPGFVERSRITAGEAGSDPSDPSGGCFVVRNPHATHFDRQVGHDILRIVANTASKASKWWEHVSVSLPHRAPTWEEMCFIKGLFWADNETVIQFHPPKADYINQHPFCLHLWRNAHKPIRTPPIELVGQRL